MGNEVASKDLMIKVEALLYASSKPVSIRTISKILGISSINSCRSIVRSLVNEYKEGNRAMVITEVRKDYFVMHLKPELAKMVRMNTKQGSFKKGLLKTLSAIAFNQPVKQSDLANSIGKSAYRNIKELLEMGLIDVEKDGKTKVLRTSELFASYMGVTNNIASVKAKLKKLLESSDKGEGALIDILTTSTTSSKAEEEKK